MSQGAGRAAWLLQRRAAAAGASPGSICTPLCYPGQPRLADTLCRALILFSSSPLTRWQIISLSAR